MEKPATHSESAGTQDRVGGQSSDLLDILILLAKRKTLIAGVTLGVGVVAALVSLVWPHSYTASTRIMPPQQAQSLATLVAGQIGLGALGPGAFALKNPSDIYVSILKGRTISDAIIQRFKLKELWESETDVGARLELESRVTVLASRDGIISVAVVDSDPVRAADIANAYIEELERLTLRIAVTDAGQRRLYFESQLKSAKDDLTNAEIGLRTFLEESGLALPEGQTQLAISAAAQLRAEVTAKEVQLAAMRSFAAERNPDLLRAEQELASLRKQLSMITNGAKTEGGDVLLALRRVPGASQTYLQRLREVKYQEVIFELLAKQYEIAKAEEAKNATVIQVIDRAVPPDRRSWPKRTLIVIVSGLAAFMVAILWVLITAGIQKWRDDPEDARKVAALGASWRVWRNP